MIINQLRFENKRTSAEAELQIVSQGNLLNGISLDVSNIACL